MVQMVGTRNDIMCLNLCEESEGAEALNASLVPSGSFSERNPA
jgi:hypothetical protein